MHATWWRGALFTGLSLALFADPVGAQDTDVLSLNEALERSGVSETAAENSRNPRLVGPTEDAAAARALIDQAGLKPNPELAFEAENLAGSGAFSGLSATEYTLSIASPRSACSFRQVSKALLLACSPKSSTCHRPR